MKLSPDERQIYEAIRSHGGSLCPDQGFTPNRDQRRILARLDRNGVIRIEPVDTGFRYSLRGGEDG